MADGLAMAEPEATRQISDGTYRLGLLGLALLSLAVNMAASWRAGIPAPHVHDEFSNLLAGQTFSAGRLTNPPHPFWQHFEAIHIIQQPTYMAKYPPGQGFVLALGLTITGQAIWGVWIVAALASVATASAVRAWLGSPLWALIGGCLVALHPLVLQWNQSYWGGTLAMLGSALLVRGAGFFPQSRRWTTSLLAATGVSILALTRPYEGLVLTLLLGAFLAWDLFRQRGQSSRASWPALLAAALVLSALVAFVGYYNFRVTGNATTLPYSLHERQYASAPVFLFQPPPDPPSYRHVSIAAFHSDWSLRMYQEQLAPQTRFRRLAGKILRLLRATSAGGLLLIPLVALPSLLRDRATRRALLVLAVASACSLLTTWLLPHYVAGLMPLAAVVCVGGAMRMARWRIWALPIGKIAVVLIGAMLIGQLVREMFLLRLSDYALQRQQVLDQLAHEPGRKLVFVAYEPPIDPHREWVYNSPDIDSAEVVFARPLTEVSDKALIRHMRPSSLWRLRVTGEDVTLERM